MGLNAPFPTPRYGRSHATASLSPSIVRGSVVSVKNDEALGREFQQRVTAALKQKPDWKERFGPFWYALLQGHGVGQAKASLEWLGSKLGIKTTGLIPEAPQQVVNFLLTPELTLAGCYLPLKNAPTLADGTRQPPVPWDGVVLGDKFYLGRGIEVLPPHAERLFQQALRVLVNDPLASQRATAFEFEKARKRQEEA